jgi:hypothetical protein
MGDGKEQITDVVEFTRLIRQARSIYFRAFLLSLGLTLLALLVPSLS